MNKRMIKFLLKSAVFLFIITAKKGRYECVNSDLGSWLFPLMVSVPLIYGFIHLYYGEGSEKKRDFTSLKNSKRL